MAEADWPKPTRRDTSSPRISASASSSVNIIGGSL